MAGTEKSGSVGERQQKSESEGKGGGASGGCREGVREWVGKAGERERVREG